MENQFKIRAAVPTHHTAGDLGKAFNMPIKQTIGGSFISEDEFLTEKEAKEYLVMRLDRYRDHSDMTEEEYQEQLFNIEDSNYLKLCHITANILENETN